MRPLKIIRGDDVKIVDLDAPKEFEAPIEIERDCSVIHATVLVCVIFLSIVILCVRLTSW